MRGPALLVADCVGKSFAGRRVLSAASLRVTPGEVRALLGRNGSGKSTLLKIAAGWMRPDSGSVHWDSKYLARPRTAELARQGLFYLPDRDLLSTAFSVRAQLRWISARFGGDEPERAMEMAGVAHCLDHHPQDLSGGERRRTELAAVLVRRPRCLLADEPYRGIDPHDAEVVTQVLRTLADAGCAVAITGHEVPTLMSFADHVTWCTSGTTYEIGTPHEARAHDGFRREYLGA